MKHDDPRHRHAAPPPRDGDGVRVTEHTGRVARPVLLYRALALALVVGSVAWLLHRHWAASPVEPDAEIAAETDAEDAMRGPDTGERTTLEARPVANVPDRALKAKLDDPTLGATPDLSAYATPGLPAPTMGEVIDRLHKAGIHSGLGAFNPPGTSPPLVGIAVPEDFPLPEGYVRHYQATDDGQRIEPILMFSPDYVFRDASGQVVPMPANRVVPPEYAPPGMAIRLVRIPPPLVTGRPTI